MTFARTLLVTAGMLTIMTAGASAQSASNQCSQQCAGAINQAICIQACTEQVRRSRRGKTRETQTPAPQPPMQFELPKGYDGPGGGSGGGRGT